jgi:hypothetical protein
MDGWNPSARHLDTQNVTNAVGSQKISPSSQPLLQPAICVTATMFHTISSVADVVSTPLKGAKHSKSAGKRSRSRKYVPIAHQTLVNLHFQRQRPGRRDTPMCTTSPATALLDSSERRIVGTAETRTRDCTQTVRSKVRDPSPASQPLPSAAFPVATMLSHTISSVARATSTLFWQTDSQKH